MSEYLQKIVYLTESQYATLAGGGTVGSQTGLNDNYIYLTDGKIGLTDIDSSFVLPVNLGGTGAASWTSGKILVGNGSNTFTTIDKTPNATANTLVERDSNKGFSTGAITVVNTAGFNYSGIESATANASRNIWFSDSATVGKPVYNNNFKYNPNTTALTIDKLTITGGTTDSTITSTNNLTLSTGSGKTLILNTATISTAGKITSPGGIVLSATDSDKASISFSRTTANGGPNYINVPTNGELAVSVGGIAGANIRFRVSNTTVDPYTTNTVDLGKTDARWKDLYLSGTVNIYRSTTTSANIPARISFTVKDTNLNTENAGYIAYYHDHSTSYNGNLVITSAGNTFIGAGESAATLYSAKGASTGGENLFLTSDSIVYVYANADTAANRIGFAIDTNGNIIPQKAEAANNDQQNLGTSGNRWNGIYGNTLYAGIGTTVAPGNETAVDRIIIQPYYHRGLWKFTSADTSSNAFLKLMYSSSELIRVKHDGCIGINTANPTNKLEVTGSSLFTGNFEVRGNVIRFRNANNDNNQASSNPWVTSLLIGDSQHVALNEYRDDYLAIKAKGLILTSRANAIAAYNSSSTYAVGDIVWYNKEYYICTTAIATAEAWTAAHWRALSVANAIVTEGNIQPIKTEAFDLGTSALKWKNIYANTLYGTAKHASAAHWSTIGGAPSGVIKIKIKKKANWMLAFTIRVYQAYTYDDYIISGYDYGSNNWYSPQAILLGSTSTEKHTVSFGYDDDAVNGYKTLWVSIPVKQYTGIDIFNVTNGFTQIDIHDAFEIIHETTSTGTVQTTVDCYRPWYRDETIPITNGGTGVTDKANIFTDISWTAGTTAGPILSATVLGQTRTATIPAASQTASGIITTGTQNFQGRKRFGNITFRAYTDSGTANQYPGDVYLENNAGTRVAEYWYNCGSATNISHGQFSWRQWSPQSTADTTTTGYYETYSLPAVSKGLTEHKGYAIITTKNLSDITSVGNISADINIIAGDTDKFINFWYNTDKKAGASWRTGMLGTGANDTNYYVIESGTSTTSATTWNRVLQIGQNTYDTGFAGNIYPISTNSSKTLGTSTNKWANVYATTFTGDLEGMATTLKQTPKSTEAECMPSAKEQMQLFRTASDSSGLTNDGHILGFTWSTVDKYGAQLFIDTDPTYKIALRQRDSSGTWQNWKLIPMGDGTNASGTWGISITGNATTATTASKLSNTALIGNTDRPVYFTADGVPAQTTYRMAGTNATATAGITYSNDLDTGIWYVGGISGDDKTTLFNQQDGVIIANKYSTSWISEIFQDYRTGQLAVRGKNNGTWQAWRKILDTGNTTAPSTVPTLAWGTESTVFTLNGTAVKVKAMDNPVSATSVKAALSTSSGTAKFLREDGTWSNIIKQTSAAALGIDSNAKIGSAVKDLHFSLGSGSGTDINSGNAGGITFGTDYASYGGIYWQTSGSYGSRIHFATTASFSSGAYTRMIILPTGNVGIDTLTPATKLEVNGITRATSYQITANATITYNSTSDCVEIIV